MGDAGAAVVADPDYRAGCMVGESGLQGGEDGEADGAFVGSGGWGTDAVAGEGGDEEAVVAGPEGEDLGVWLGECWLGRVGGVWGPTCRHL